MKIDGEGQPLGSAIYPESEDVSGWGFPSGLIVEELPGNAGRPGFSPWTEDPWRRK